MRRPSSTTRLPNGCCPATRWPCAAATPKTPSPRHAPAALAACTAPGSRIVFDYWSAHPPTAAGNLLLWGTRLAVALQQEPMLSFFDPDEIETLAGDAGWRVTEHLTPAAQNKRYLAGRQDGLVVPSFAHLLQLTNAAEV